MSKPDPKPTHWKDDRGLSISDAYRTVRGEAWINAYNVPCKVGAFGRIVPLHKCTHCNGKGHDPDAIFDGCPVCGRSGGLPASATSAKEGTRQHPDKPGEGSA